LLNKRDFFNNCWGFPPETEENFRPPKNRDPRQNLLIFSFSFAYQNEEQKQKENFDFYAQSSARKTRGRQEKSVLKAFDERGQQSPPPIIEELGFFVFLFFTFLF